MIPLLFFINTNFIQEISDVSIRIKYEIINDEIASFGYNTVVEKINKAKEVQEQHTRFLSFSKTKSDEKKSKIAMYAKHLEIRKKFGKRIDFSGVVYKILYSYNDIPDGIRMCDCVYCILNKDNAGDIIGSAKPRVKIIGDKYDILQIYAPYGGYEHYMKICKSKIPHMAKKLGFTRIKYDEFSNYEDWNYAGHYEKKL